MFKYYILSDGNYYGILLNIFIYIQCNKVNVLLQIMNLFYVILWLCLHCRRRRTYTILHAGGKPAQTCQRMSQSVLARRSFKVKQYLSYDPNLFKILLINYKMLHDHLISNQLIMQYMAVTQISWHPVSRDFLINSAKVHDRSAVVSVFVVVHFGGLDPMQALPLTGFN